MILSHWASGWGDLAAVAAVTVCGLLAGGPAEKRGVGLFALGWTLSWAAQAVWERPDPVLALLAVDSGLVLAFGALSWRAGRAWPAAAVAASGLGAAIGAMRLASPDPSAAAYLAGEAAAGYLLAAILLWASLRFCGLRAISRLIPRRLAP